MRIESEKATRKMATAAAESEPRSDRETSGERERRETARYGAGDGHTLGGEVQRPGRGDAQDHQHECARDALADPGKDDEESERKGCHHDRRTVRVAEMADDVDCFADGPILVAGDAEHLAQLSQDQHDRYSGDVADQDRLREVVSDPAEANETSREEHETHQEGEHGCQHGMFCAPAGGERSEHRRDQQRHSAFRPDDDPRR